MEIVLTLQEIQTHHANLLPELLTKLRSTNNRDSNTPVEQCQFYYSYGMSIKAQTLDDLFREISKQPRDEQPIVPRPKLNQLLRTVIGLSLCICAGRTRRYVTFAQMPALFIEKFTAHYAEELENQEREEQRIANLTEEERNREIQENLNSLMEDGDFIGLNITPDGASLIKPKAPEYNINDILDKIGRLGMNGLTEGEKKFLEQSSNQLP